MPAYRYFAAILLSLLLVACDGREDAAPTTAPTITTASTAIPPAATPTQPIDPTPAPSPTAEEQATAAVEQPIISWTSAGGPCQMALINLHTVAVNNCEDAALATPLSEQRRIELAAFVAMYDDFQANTVAGQVSFNNRSQSSLNAVTRPAEQRMFAEWARAVAAEIMADSEAIPGSALTWRREDSNRCDDLAVHLTGWAYASSCANGELEPLGSEQLWVDQLEQLYAAVDSTQPFTIEETAGDQVVTLTLAGQGNDPASATLQEELGRFATGLFDVLAAGATRTAVPEVEPFVRAPFIVIDSWSPGGEWLAYWLSSEEDIDNQEPYASPGGTLYFANVTTGEECAMSQFTTQTAFSAGVAWTGSETAVVVTADGAFSGQPCQAESFTATDVPVVHNLPDPALSPDGRFQAATTQTAAEDRILTFETTLTEVNSAQTLQRVTWQIDQRLGEYGLGGQWVSPEQFLIHETLEGFLLIHVADGVVPAHTEQFGLAAIPSLAEEAEGYVLRASALSGPETNTFHLLTYGVGLEGRVPPILLYHAESGQAETLPFRKAWGSGFLSDGRWLLLYETVLNEGYESGYNLWVRQLEDVDGDWELAAADAEYFLWTAGGDELAYGQRETTIYRQHFPGGELIGAWNTGQYWTVPIAFSPDGRYLATTGNIPGQNEYALFILPGLVGD
jgi:hypothetical protein